jgi:phosphatidate cytidylyltransferase
LITSAVAIGGLLFLVWADYLIGIRWGYRGAVMTGLVLIVAFLAGEELRRMFATESKLGPWQVAIAVGLACGVGCAPVGWREYPADCPIGRLGWMAVGYALAAAWTFVLEIARYRRGEKSLDRVQQTLLIVGYLMLFLFIVHLRFALDDAWGIVAILSLLLTVKMSDSFAYLVGKAVGRTKMSPNLSPGKTVEGGVAALVFGCAGAGLALYPLSYWIAGEFAARRVAVWLVFGVAVALAGIVGDLAESLLKRESDHKDSGSMIPGMGGVLDVIDSVVGAAPLVYLLWVGGLVGPG